jgi:hypothetical protein
MVLACLVTLSVSSPHALSPQELSALFKNDFPETAELFWFDADTPDGVKMADVPSNGKIDMSTFTGHTFFFKVPGFDQRFEFTIGNEEIESYDLLEEGKKPVVRKVTSSKTANKWIQNGLDMMAESKQWSVPIKFTNYHDNDLEIFYDDGQEGVTQGYLRANRTMCINSYVGHKFFFTPIGSKERVAKAQASADSFENLLKPKNMRPELAERVAAEEKFRGDYYEENGFHWLSGYGRPKPRWHMWEAKEVGQKHTVKTNNTFMHREPEKGEEAGQCQVDEETTFQLEVLSTHPKVFKIENFLSDEECAHIIQKGKEGLARSTTGGMLSDTRTSQTAWVSRQASTMMDGIVRRVADLVKVMHHIWPLFIRVAFTFHSCVVPRK